MDSKELRQKFLSFFKERGHKEMPPASLIPENDPSVLFTTAGMQQFKRFYTHPEEALAKNVVTCQPCFRTSDIEEVGDETHLTFFEMLGNFSFGGYFKKETIEWAYEFLTKDLGVEKEKIWCSIFAGDKYNPKDDESAKILEAMGIKYKEFPREDCFWGPTGEEGPCGPCIEIYVGDVEVWTLVFNEYYCRNGQYEPLEIKGVDTGMGLERMLAVLNKKNDVFETDLFEPIIGEIEKVSNSKYQDWTQVFRIISDHAKASAFAINDGILPSNKDAGYIVRRLIRRAVIKAKKLGINDNFTAILANEIFQIYKSIYSFEEDKVKEELAREENKFDKIIGRLGTVLLSEDGSRLITEDGKAIQIEGGILSGKEAFDLYQTYGLPMEMIKEIAEEKDLKLDGKGFKEELKKHQELSRTASAGMFKGGLAGGGEQEIKYHSATHLLLAALRQILGDGVHQKGSNITAERLRFDFSQPEKLTDEQIKQVEDIVNQKIKEDLPVKMEEMSLEDARNCGAASIPGFKYPEKVKVFSIGRNSSTIQQVHGRPEQNRGTTSSEPPFSREICGGPHMEHTGLLGHFEIIKEEASSAGVRRIKAILK